MTGARREDFVKGSSGCDRRGNEVAGAELIDQPRVVPTIVQKSRLGSGSLAAIATKVPTSCPSDGVAKLGENIDALEMGLISPS